MEAFPDVVLGPPHGGGPLQGSLHVLSLGDGGEIVLEFECGICDGPGPDFTVFENPFHAGGPDGALFVEVGIVAVSGDGESFVDFPFDPRTFAGLAGRTPVLSHPDNGIDPTDPAVSGGDTFDLAEVGLVAARFVRITDPGAWIPDPGNRLPPGRSGGFDLDAIAVVNACAPRTTPSLAPTAANGGGTATPTPSPTSTATASATPTPTPSGAVIGDLDGDGDLDETDLALLIRAIFRGGEVRHDLNGDGRITAADLVSASWAGVRPR